MATKNTAPRKEPQQIAGGETAWIDGINLYDEFDQIRRQTEHAAKVDEKYKTAISHPLARIYRIVRAVGNDEARLEAAAAAAKITLTKRGEKNLFYTFIKALFPEERSPGTYSDYAKALSRAAHWRFTHDDVKGYLQAHGPYPLGAGRHRPASVPAELDSSKRKAKRAGDGGKGGHATPAPPPGQESAPPAAAPSDGVAITSVDSGPARVVGVNALPLVVGGADSISGPVVSPPQRQEGAGQRGLGIGQLYAPKYQGRKAGATLEVLLDETGRFVVSEVISYYTFQAANPVSEAPVAAPATSQQNQDDHPLPPRADALDPVDDDEGLDHDDETDWPSRAAFPQSGPDLDGEPDDRENDDRPPPPPLFRTNDGVLSTYWDEKVVPVLELSTHNSGQMMVIVEDEKSATPEEREAGIFYITCARLLPADYPIPGGDDPQGGDPADDDGGEDLDSGEQAPPAGAHHDAGPSNHDGGDLIGTRTTNIRWTAHTWNPFVGCSPASAGCANCYAVKFAHRLGCNNKAAYVGTTHTDTADGHPVWTGQINFNSEDQIEKPLSIKKPSLVFCGSMTDFWHPNATDEMREQVFEIMEMTPQHRYQILTKRPHLIMPALQRMGRALPANVWIGTTVEDARVLDRIDHLRQVPATVRFLSVEPLIGALGELNLDGIGWVIVGGEKAKNARPMSVEWVRDIQSQCLAADVPFFFKQWGSNKNNNPLAAGFQAGRLHKEGLKAYLVRVAGEDHGHLLDGQIFEGFPVDHTWSEIYGPTAKPCADATESEDDDNFDDDDDDPNGTGPSGGGGVGKQVPSSTEAPATSTTSGHGANAADRCPDDANRLPKPAVSGSTSLWHFDGSLLPSGQARVRNMVMAQIDNATLVEHLDGNDEPVVLKRKRATMVRFAVISGKFYVRHTVGINEPVEQVLRLTGWIAPDINYDRALKSLEVNAADLHAAFRTLAGKGGEAADQPLCLQGNLDGLRLSNAAGESVWLPNERRKMEDGSVPSCPSPAMIAAAAKAAALQNGAQP